MPISAFAHALRAFHSGQLTYDDLIAEVDRQLTIERTSAAVLLRILQMQQSAQPLPSEAHGAIAKLIEEWPQDPTILTGPAPAARAPGAACVGVGDILQGRFSLVELIGEGGMSRVFKAVDLRRAEADSIDPHVAVKVLTEPFHEYFGSMAALQREAHKLRSLTHPNIVRVIDCDRDGQTVFMTMEYLHGQSLQKLLRSAAPGGLPPATALALISAIGDALEYAHANHIVHGDLKPGNVIVTERGPIKVIDFGMAKFIARADMTVLEAANHPSPKAITPRYASPQMAAGHDPEPADDVYALACMAYEALSGKHPLAVKRGEAAPEASVGLPRPPRMPAHQYGAIVRALASDRNNRTASIRRFLDELLARRSRAAIKRAAPYCAAAIVLLVTAWYWMHGGGAPSRSADAASAALFLPGSVMRDCPTCPLMTVLPAGSFQQGDASADSSAASFESPRHPVTIARPFAMSSNEVTVGEFREFVVGTNRPMFGCTTYEGRWEYQPGANWQAPGFAQSDMHPVTCVSWDDAHAYAQWLSIKTGQSYRLPSASEWEYAARAGGDAMQPWGANAAAACAAANVADQSALRRFPGWATFPCTDNYVNTAPVGSFKANAFGLKDLLGNVFEWVEDCWYDDYSGAPNDGSAKVDAGCAERELRGGSWFSAPQYVSASYRNRFDHDYRSSSIGIRLARDIGP